MKDRKMIAGGEPGRVDAILRQGDCASAFFVL